MDADLIVRLPVFELRRAAANGTAYYNCEQFEDAYGRLVVGIGARLEGRTLSYVARCGRKTLYVSPVAVCDSPQFRSALRRAMQRESAQAEGRGDGGNGACLEGWDKVDASVRKAVGEAMQAVSRVSPDMAKLIASLHPHPRDLAHGVQVATYAQRLTDAFNRARDCGRISASYAYSARVQETVFLAGVMHDIGRWNNRPVEGHAERGAEILKDLAERCTRLYGLAELVAQHHRPLSKLRGRAWKMHKVAPVALAEAVVEFPGSPGGAVYRLVLDGAPEAAGAILAVLCNTERVAPPRAVVRMRRLADENRVEAPVELAVSLRAPEEDPFRPYLLRFARQDERGCLVPLLRSGGGEKEAAACLTAPGHPVYAQMEWEVVGLLSEGVYEQTFGRYDRLAPAFRTALERRFRERNTTPTL